MAFFAQLGLLGSTLAASPRFKTINVSGFVAGRQMPVASTAFRCRDLLPLARPPQQIVAAAFVSRSGTLVVTNSYDDTTSITGHKRHL